MGILKRSDSESVALSRRLGSISTICCQLFGFEATQLLLDEYGAGKSYDDFSDEAKSIVEKAEASLGTANTD